MKKVAVLQSNYLPWKGYFDIIHDVDLFIFHDDLQYTKNDWRNRNKVATPGGPKWLTVPAGTNEHRLIVDVKLEDSRWQRDHYNKLCAYYKKAPYFHCYEPFLNKIYLQKEWTYLFELNRYIIERIAVDFLGIQTKFDDSRNFKTHGQKHEKLLSMLASAGAEAYVSGPAAKSYIDEADYREAGVRLAWKNYDGYPEYEQLYKPFSHNLSVLDLLFNTGDDASYYIWGWRDKANSSYQFAGC